MSTDRMPRSDTSKQRKHRHKSTKFREQKRAEFAEHFRKGFDQGYEMGLAEGKRRSNENEFHTHRSTDAATRGGT